MTILFMSIMDLSHQHAAAHDDVFMRIMSIKGLSNQNAAALAREGGSRARGRFVSAIWMIPALRRSSTSSKV